jgi:general secretion pathway protein D
MRVGKTAMAVVMVFSSLVWCMGAFAQEKQDSDLESLLSDIGSAPQQTSTTEQAAGEAAPAPAATEPAVTEAPAPAAPATIPEPEAPAAPAAPAEPLAPAPAEQPAAPAEPSTDDFLTTPEPAAVEQPTEAAQPAATAEEPVVEAPAVEPVVEAPAAAPAEESVVTSEPAPAEVVEPAPETVVTQDAPVEVAPEAAPAEAAAPAPAKVGTREARKLAEQEEIRRQALETQALKNLEEGYKQLNAGDFAGSIKNFENTLANLPERPATLEQREQAKWGLAEALYRSAWAEYDKRGNMAEARQNAEKALKLDPAHKGVDGLLKKIAKEEYRQSLPLPPSEAPAYVEKKTEVNKLIKEGIQFYDLKEYTKAEALFEQVLVIDEYNVDAMRYLKKIEDIRYKISTKERDATVAGLMKDVRDAWNPPIREEVRLPEEVMARGAVETKTATQRLQDRMAKIMIPSIEFRSANITDVINFLVEASIAGDPEGVGVNIVLNLSIPGEGGAVAAAAAPAAPAADDPWGAATDTGSLSTEAAPAVGVKTITLNLRRISLLDAVKYITEVAGLKYRLEDNAVIITPAGVVSGRVITRMYPVQPSILDVIISKEDTGTEERTGEFIEMGSKTTVKRSDVKEFFEKAGVPFPVGTSITYNQSISQLIVANTPDNLEIFERILAQLNVVPNQVEIEARFVEVAENDLEELGLQWILTDNFELAKNKNSIGGISSQERIQANANPNGITQGNRFFGFDNSTASVGPISTITKGVNQSFLGNILSFSSILTNPEMTLIIQALSQHGGADLLSAPRVTTRSGVNAQIQVVREIIYPTEFEVTQPTVQSEGALVTPPTVTPGSFETREIGVILNVTPTVGPDGYTIDLVMVPEVAELVDWIQYGSEITLETPIVNVLGVQVGSRANTFQFNIPQPVFSSRKVTTSIVIWDGQTVVMGGLIREELVTIKDKIPILGDIPLLGRLFRTEGQSSKKMNLLIFVTARLVDPSGKPIHKAEAMAMPGGGATATAETVKP